MGNLTTGARAWPVLSLFTLALPALWPASLQAAEAAAGTLAGCRTLHAEAARLACYDRLPDPPGATVPAVAAAAPAPPAPAPTPEARFGISELRQARAEAAKAPAPPQLKELRAQVTQVHRQAAGGLRLTLANGQVWYQVVASEQLEVAPGDEIIIKPASLGSFLLVDHDRHSARVHRAQ